jgi:hypothetical protein
LNPGCKQVLLTVEMSTALTLPAAVSLYPKFVSEGILVQIGIGMVAALGGPKPAEVAVGVKVSAVPSYDQASDHQVPGAINFN